MRAKVNACAFLLCKVACVSVPVCKCFCVIACFCYCICVCFPFVCEIVREYNFACVHAFVHACVRGGLRAATTLTSLCSLPVFICFPVFLFACYCYFI